MHPMDSWHGRQGIGPHPSLNSGVLPPKRDPAADVPGNHLDDCGVCVILPTVSGQGVRGTQVSCPVHGEARSDLPEGQQSNLGPFFNESAEDLNVSIRKLVAGLDTLGIRPYADNPSSWSWVLFCLDGIDKLQREVARVRAAVAGEIAEEIESYGFGGECSAVYERCAYFARKHGRAPAEPSVGSPTPDVGTQDVRDAAWQAYMAEDSVGEAIDAAIRVAVERTLHRSKATRARVMERHARRPDGHCVMCRWPDGSLVEWPCPDQLDARQADPLPETQEGAKP